MLTARGLSDTVPSGLAAATAAPMRPHSSSHRSRSQLEDERRQQRVQSCEHWEAVRARRHEACDVAKAVADRVHMRRSAAITKLRMPESSAAPPPSAAPGGESLIAGFVLKGKSARPTTKNADEVPRGVRRIAGKDNNKECATYFKDVVAKRTFPDHPAMVAHTELGVAAANSHGGGGSSADDCSMGSTDVTPRPTLKPELPESARKHRPLTGTIGRVVNIEHLASPPIVPLHKMYVMRPEVTANDSYAVPVYSSFTLNHKFDPMLDEALKPYHRRMQKRKEEAMRKLKMRHVIHATAVDDYNLALARKLSTQQMLAIPIVTDEEVIESKATQTIVEPMQATPRGAYENNVPTLPKREDVSGARAAITTTATLAGGLLNEPNSTASTPSKHSAPHEPTTRPQTAKQQRPSVAALDPHSAAGAPSFSAPTPPKRPQTARTRPSGLQVVFANAAATASTAPQAAETARLDDLERLETLVARSVASSRPSSANRPLCSPAMAIEFGVARQDAPIRARSAASNTTRSDNGLTPSEQLDS